MCVKTQIFTSFVLFTGDPVVCHNEIIATVFSNPCPAPFLSLLQPHGNIFWCIKTYWNWCIHFFRVFTDVENWRFAVKNFLVFHWLKKTRWRCRGKRMARQTLDFTSQRRPLLSSIQLNPGYRKTARRWEYTGWILRRKVAYFLCSCTAKITGLLSLFCMDALPLKSCIIAQ